MQQSKWSAKYSTFADQPKPINSKPRYVHTRTKNWPFVEAFTWHGAPGQYSQKQSASQSMPSLKQCILFHASEIYFGREGICQYFLASKPSNVMMCPATNLKSIRADIDKCLTKNYRRLCECNTRCTVLKQPTALSYKQQHVSAFCRISGIHASENKKAPVAFAAHLCRRLYQCCTMIQCNGVTSVEITVLIVQMWFV